MVRAVRCPGGVQSRSEISRRKIPQVNVIESFVFAVVQPSGETSCVPCCSSPVRCRLVFYRFAGPWSVIGCLLRLRSACISRKSPNESLTHIWFVFERRSGPGHEPNEKHANTPSCTTVLTLRCTADYGRYPTQPTLTRRRLELMTVAICKWRQFARDKIITRNFTVPNKTIFLKLFKHAGHKVPW